LAKSSKSIKVKTTRKPLTRPMSEESTSNSTHPRGLASSTMNQDDQ
jgi:hypothetical protein